LPPPENTLDAGTSLDFAGKTPYNPPMDSPDQTIGYINLGASILWAKTF